MAARARGRPVDGDSQATRRHILLAARAVFSEYGYAGTTYRRLETRTGYSTATLYHYFSSKKELYRTLLDETNRQMTGDWLQPAVDSAETLVGKLEALFAAVEAMHTAHPELVAFFLSNRGEAGRNKDVAAFDTSVRTRRQMFFGSIADAGIRSGELRRADRGVLISVLDAMTFGLAEAALLGDDFTQVIDGYLRLLRSELITPFVSANSRRGTRGATKSRARRTF